jgi:hypothetical protein
MTLRNINLPWMSLSHLKHLDLNQSFDSTPFNVPSFGLLLSILALSPQLKTLSLRLVIPPAIRGHE